MNKETVQITLPSESGEANHKKGPKKGSEEARKTTSEKKDIKSFNEIPSSVVEESQPALEKQATKEETNSQSTPPPSHEEAPTKRREIPGAENTPTNPDGSFDYKATGGKAIHERTGSYRAPDLVKGILERNKEREERVRKEAEKKEEELRKKQEEEASNSNSAEPSHSEEVQGQVPEAESDPVISELPESNGDSTEEVVTTEVDKNPPVSAFKRKKGKPLLQLPKIPLSMKSVVLVAIASIILLAGVELLLWSHNHEDSGVRAEISLEDGMTAVSEETYEESDKVEVLGIRNRELRDALTAKNTEIDTLKKGLVSDGGNQKLMKEVQTKNAKIAKLEEEIVKKDGEIQTLNDKLALAGEDHSLSEKITTLEAENESLKGELALTKNQLAKVETVVQRLEQEKTAPPTPSPALAKNDSTVPNGDHSIVVYEGDREVEVSGKVITYPDYEYGVTFFKNSDGQFVRTNGNPTVPEAILNVVPLEKHENIFLDQEGRFYVQM